MGEDHPFHVLLRQKEKTPQEGALLAAIMLLSVDRYSHLTPEQVYDQLVLEYSQAFGEMCEPGQPFLSMLYRRILNMEKSMTNQLNRMERQLMVNSTALSRLQTDNDALSKKLTDQQTSLTNLASAQTAAFARFQDDLDALKAAGNNEDALNAVADSLETTMAGFQSVTDGLNAAAGVAAGEDVPASTPPAGGGTTPPATTTLVISPASVNLPPGGSQQFSANVPVAWSAQSGSIDANGNYIAPGDLTLTSDVVTATPTDTTIAAVNASVSIG